MYPEIVVQQSPAIAQFQGITGFPDDVEYAVSRGHAHHPMDVRRGGRAEGGRGDAAVSTRPSPFVLAARVALYLQTSNNGSTHTQNKQEM